MTRKTIARLAVTGAVAAAAALSGVAVAAAPAAAAPPPKCAAADLTARFVGPHQGTAGTEYTDVRITNTGDDDCTLKGVPKGRFLKNGVVIGGPSQFDGWEDRNGDVRIDRITLDGDGGRAYVRVGIEDASNFDNCRPTQPSALRLRLPRLADPVRVSFGNYDVQVCRSTDADQLTLSQILKGRTTNT
jgi:hypothetical protein